MRTGLLTGISRESKIEPHRLKRALAVIDTEPLFDQNHLRFLKWCSDYYHHPPGEVMVGTLPTLLAQGRPVELQHETCWKITKRGLDARKSLPANAARQQALLDLIAGHPNGLSEDDIRSQFENSRATLRVLADKGWINLDENRQNDMDRIPRSIHDVQLNEEQACAVKQITAAGDINRTFLLNGVTGSGKTEVYLQSIKPVILSGKQALVLVPEIGLTPQFIEHFRKRLDIPIGVLHSGLTDRERMQNWSGARSGRLRVIIGTRSAVWTPLRNPGLIIVDEEHDLSYKQQDGFRYSARDLALVRARILNIPVVLGSATPSLETACNVSRSRYQELRLMKRAGDASLPEIRLQDLRGARMTGALTTPVLDSISDCLRKKQQVLLFLNRRGYAPVLLCHDCGWVAKCPRCETHMTLHKHINKLCCHHCLHQEKIATSCPQCSSGKILEIGHGTQRLAETLTNIFPDARIARIDRDSTRRKGTMHKLLADAEQGHVDLLIGTQMLAKGHHFPGVALVVIIDADHGLYSTDFRAGERMAQIITQVSGRSGRTGSKGSVIIQTHHPEHPLLQSLISQDYAATTKLLLAERKVSSLPPFSYQVLLRAEAGQQSIADVFLQDARRQLPSKTRGLEVYGPYPAAMEKRAGRYRMQLLLQMQNRKELRDLTENWITRIEQLKSGKRALWSIDVDPQDMI